MPKPPWWNPARSKVPFRPPGAPKPPSAEPAPAPEDPQGQEVEPMYGVPHRFDRDTLNAFLSGLEQAHVKITYDDLFRAAFEVPRGVKAHGVNTRQGGVDLVNKAVRPELRHLVVHSETPINVGKPTESRYDPSVKIDENLAAATIDWPVLPDSMTQSTGRVLDPETGRYEVQEIHRETKLPLTGAKVAERFLRQLEQLSGTGEFPNVKGIIDEIKAETAAKAEADKESDAKSLAAKAFDEPRPKQTWPQPKPTDPKSLHYTPPIPGLGLDPDDKSLRQRPDVIEPEEEMPEDPGQGNLADVHWLDYLHGIDDEEELDPAFFNPVKNPVKKQEVSTDSGRSYEEINPETPDEARVEYFAALPERIAALKSEYTERSADIAARIERGETVPWKEREEVEALRSQAQNLEKDLTNTAKHHQFRGRRGFDLGFEAMGDFVHNRITIEDPEAQLEATRRPGGLAAWYGAYRGRMMAAARKIKILVKLAKDFEIESILKGLQAGLIRTMSKYEGADREIIFTEMERFLDKMVTGKTWNESSFDPSEDYISKLTRDERTTLSNHLASEDYRTYTEEDVQQMAFRILLNR